MLRMTLAHDKCHGLFWVLKVCHQTSQFIICHSSQHESRLWADLKEPKAKASTATMSQG